jgi:hypothetical protein
MSSHHCKESVPQTEREIAGKKPLTILNVILGGKEMKQHLHMAPKSQKSHHVFYFVQFETVVLDLLKMVFQSPKITPL